jgi:ActR/RegA family two-component response regulator
LLLAMSRPFSGYSSTPSVLRALTLFWKWLEDSLVPHASEISARARLLRIHRQERAQDLLLNGSAACR